jgi:hypothetical protein
MDGLLCSAGLFLAILLCFEIGRRAGTRRLGEAGAGASAGASVIEGAILALLGLLVAFTFFGAAARFDERRDLIVEEANRIGTAYLRLDLLPEAAQPAIKESFRRYVDTRLAFYRALVAAETAPREWRSGVELQGEIWRQAITGSTTAGAHVDAAKLLLPALNEMFDITTTRVMAMQKHPPLVVYLMLLGLALISALVAGYGAAPVRRTRYRLHAYGFALVMAVAVYVILDLEYPRRGLIRIDAFDQVLVTLRQEME